MVKTTMDKFAKQGDLVLLAGRLLLAWIFVHEGFSLATNFDAASVSMAKQGVPAFALMATIALQLAAGFAIAVGWYAQLGAAALGVFCLTTAMLFHRNFAVRNELLHFEKDLAIAGGMLVLMLHGAGRWSMDSLWRPAYATSALAEGHMAIPGVEEHAAVSGPPLAPGSSDASLQALGTPTMFPR
jgi:putative oxidoreductase